MLTVNNTLVMLVDVQERLLPHMHDADALLARMEILLKGCKALDLPILVNEQYKKGLGEIVEPLRNILGEYSGLEKTSFSCCKNGETMEVLCGYEQEYVVLFGIETHICVLQTALDLLEKGKKPVVVMDCVGSRKPYDTKVAFARMVQAGVIPTTYESVLFELLEGARHEAFKTISGLIK